jgi:uncharacterized membrane protein YGL010W
MFLEKDKPHRIVLLALGAITLILGVLLFIAPPSIFPDPGWGFQVMRSMQQGAHFNILASPNPDNIAINQNDFLSWWSPGQYLVPYFLQTVLWLNTGKAVAVTVALCSLFGLLGYYKLFKRLGFTSWLSAISVAFIASQNYFILPFVFYPGGEILLFAFAGWFLYGCFGISKVNWQAMLFLFAAGILGFICKSSALWMYAAGLACVWLNISTGKKLQMWIRNGVLLAIPAGVALGIIYIEYISKGANPSNAAGAWLVKPETLSYPLASPLLSGLSVDEVFNGLIYHPDTPIISYQLSIVIIVVLAVGSLLLMRSIVRYIPNKNYILVFLVFYIASTVFFSYLYLKQATITFEGRHFRIMGVLAIPGLVYFASKSKAARIAFAIVWIAFIGWEFTYFTHGYSVNRDAAHGVSGLAQQGYDQETITEITVLDALHPHHCVFVITNPDLGIEIVHNRVMTLDVGDMTPEDFSDLNYSGKAGTIYMLMPLTYVQNGMAVRITKSFKAYQQFTVRRLSKEFYLYTASN